MTAQTQGSRIFSEKVIKPIKCKNLKNYEFLNRFTHKKTFQRTTQKQNFHKILVKLSVITLYIYLSFGGFKNNDIQQFKMLARPPPERLRINNIEPISQGQTRTKNRIFFYAVSTYSTCFWQDWLHCRRLDGEAKHNIVCLEKPGKCHYLPAETVFYIPTYRINLYRSTVYTIVCWELTIFFLNIYQPQFGVEY